jgi:hypothetical protein
VDNEEALAAAEREKLHLDQAFFVLSFAALEKHITSLACARMAEPDRRTAMREARFGDRWDAAVTVATETLGTNSSWEGSRREVLSWYKIRSDIADGRLPTTLTDVPTVLYRADEIAITSDQVAEHAARQIANQDVADQAERKSQ